jgi:Rrf2 family transcriptional regulator, nitric oxide-sensitive transcriptional repressor
VISQTTEYALRAIVDLAYHHGESRTTQQIAQATKVPAGYLAKVLKELSRHDLIRSQRGLHGGFVLETNPREITVYHVMAAVDPPQRITQCPLNLPEHKANLCPLHRRLDDAMAMVEEVFRATTIAEVTADPKSQPLGARKATMTISGGLAATVATNRKKSSRKSRKRD